MCFLVRMCLLVTALAYVRMNTDAQTDIQVLLMCDEELSYDCSQVLKSGLPGSIVLDQGSANFTIQLVNGSNDFMANLLSVEQIVSANDTRVAILVGFGTSSLVNAVTTAAAVYNIPALVYTTSRHRQILYPERAVNLSPDHSGLARAVMTVIGRQMSLNAYVVCQDSMTSDGFLDVFKEIRKDVSFYQTNHVLISSSDTDLELRLKLLNMHEGGFRLVVVHSTGNLFDRLARVASNLSYFDTGHAWILSEEAMISSLGSEGNDSQFPMGLLALEGYEADKYQQLLCDALAAIGNATESLLLNASNYGWSDTDMAKDFGDILASRRNIYDDFMRTITTNRNLFSLKGHRRNMQFRLLNFVGAHELMSHWKTVGYIHGDDLDLDAVVWPGNSIFGPVPMRKEEVTIVTRHDPPFTYISGPVASQDDCVADTVCIKVYTYDQKSKRATIESFKANDPSNENFKYDIYCCEGIVVDVLHSLSLEMNFKFLIYFQNDTNYGQYLNNTWTGMVADVHYETADIMVGATSITSDRMSVISYTEPYYYSSFNMISLNDGRFTPLFAFLNPFDKAVWFMIIVTATVVAIATSLYEWNSPFGLNPWGKCRKRNYTLGSALVMVYSIWFGHTVSTKSPKSWPSKVLQNFWAGLAIVVTASYTANLAAFLAGNAYVDTMYSILDTKLSHKKIGVVKTSAAEDYIHTINSPLANNFKNNYVKNVEEGLVKVRTKQIDMYMEDSPILEYMLSKYDDNCSVKYAAHSFGENAYAFGMKKGSWLKARFDPLVLNYVENGFVEDLKWRYMGKNRQCQNKLLTSADIHMFGFDHTGGLFVILGIAIAVSILLLIGEHIVYFILLPNLKNKPTNSLWKNRNMEYFSQRLYRAINTEKVKPPAQKLMSKVKRKRFELESRLRETRSVPADLTSFQLTRKAFVGISNMAYPGLIELDDVHPTLRRQPMSQDDIYTISSNGIDSSERGHGDDIHHQRRLADRSLQLNHNHRKTDMLNYSAIQCIDGGYENPVYESDEDEAADACAHMAYNGNIPNRHDTFSKVRFQTESFKRTPAHTDHHIRDPDCVVCSTNNSFEFSSHFPKTKSKLYETWPSPKTRRRSIKRPQNNHGKSFSHADKEPIKSISRIVNEISNKRCRKCSSASLDSVHNGGNPQLEVKDNRMKSSLRSHAMASIHQSPPMTSATVEALTKEDLLVLWKRSEIELQTRLNRTLQHNNHLRHLVDIVEQEYTAGEDSQRQVRKDNSETNKARTSSTKRNGLCVSTKL